MKFWRSPSGGGRLSDSADQPANNSMVSVSRQRVVVSTRPGDATPAIVAGYFDTAAGGTTHEASGSLTASPSLSGSLQLTAEAAAALTASPSLSGSLQLTAEAAAALTATPSLSATAWAELLAQGVLVASPSLSGSLALTLQASANLSASPSLGAAGVLQAEAEVLLSSVASLTGTADGAAPSSGGGWGPYYQPPEALEPTMPQVLTAGGSLSARPELVGSASVHVRDDEEKIGIAIYGGIR